MKKQLCALLTAAAMLLNFTPASVFATADLSLSADIVSAELKAGETVKLPVRADVNAGYAAGSVDLSWDNTALKLKSVAYSDLAPDNGSAAITDNGSYRVSFGDYNAAANTTGTGVFFTLEFEIASTAAAGDYAILLDHAKILDKDVKPVAASLQSGLITLTGDAPADAFTMSAARTEVTAGETDEIRMPVIAETNPGYISGLVDIKLQCTEGPEGMIHPNPGDTVSISYEIADAVTDDGRICSVGTHASEVRNYHLPYVIRFHEQKGQTILPQITPSSSSASVIMIWQEGTAVDPAKERLEGYP